MGSHTMNATFLLLGVSAANFSVQQLQQVAAGVQQQLSFAGACVAARAGACRQTSMA